MNVQDLLQWAGGLIITGLAWALQQHKADAKERHAELKTENDSLRRDFNDLSLKLVQEYIQKEDFAQYRAEIRLENQEFKAEIREIVRSIGVKIDRLQESIERKADK